MKKLFLLDAYALIFRSYYALIRAPRINSKGLNTSAIMGFVNTLNEIITKESPDYLGVAFDLDKTFRHEAFPAYKAQRDATPEDIKLSVPYIKDILRAFNIPILEASGFEADDVIGTLAVKAGAEGIETYMLTPDKDYGQLVRENVFMYRPRHGGGYEILGTKEIAEILTETAAGGNTDVSNAAEKLLQKALDNGGRDNITIILCRVKKRKLGLFDKIFHFLLG